MKNFFNEEELHLLCEQGVKDTKKLFELSQNFKIPYRRLLPAYLINACIIAQNMGISEDDFVDIVRKQFQL